MLTDRTQALLAAIEHQVEAGQAALEAEKERCKALEAENRALKERLLALAELDPMVVKGQDHSEDPDGGTRARGLGNLAFRRPRPKPDGDAGTGTARHGQVSPLQRLTSSPAHDKGGSEIARPLAVERTEPERSAPPEGEADSSSTRTRPEVPTDTSTPVAPSTAGESPPQSSLAFGAEHEVPSPQALLAQWYKRYPRTFFKGHTRPLKTGIHLDLCELEPWPEKLVRRALACYVHLPRYLKSVREGAKRVDLVGEDSEVVTAEEAKHAKRQLEALQKKQKARETQERSAKLDRKIGALLAKHGQSPQD
ncbi:ProQ/FINO family protein [Salinicola lusitanus]|uniref:ProQ/FINO family protein n=1 Tax=Salinicola lusitanus TaxID=1949085 RepID=A0ABZ3CMW3_9GAMM